MIAVLFVVSCSKTSETPTPTTPITPPTSDYKPTGTIESFTLTDTLVAFGYGTIAKWLVTGTNNYTIVTFNGVKIASYGAMDTGPLNRDMIFTLALNNGTQAITSVRVADSIATLLWNGGKRLKLIKAEKYVIDTSNTYRWEVDTTIEKQVLDQRINFNFNGDSKITQSTAAFVSPGDTGPVVVNGSKKGFLWRGIQYMIVTLDNKYLQVTYNQLQSNGSFILSRNNYQFE
jgi:hypothetical protein